MERLIRKGPFKCIHLYVFRQKEQGEGGVGRTLERATGTGRKESKMEKIRIMKAQGSGKS